VCNYNIRLWGCVKKMGLKLGLKHDSESELSRSAIGAIGLRWAECILCTQPGVGEAAISKSLGEDTRNEQIPTTS